MWPIIVASQIVVSSLTTITTRKLSLSNQRVFFVVGFFTYLVVAVMGILVSFASGIEPSYLPSGEAWGYILPASLLIVSSWLLLYKIITLFGASNAVLVSMANYIVTALLGFVVLDEPISPTFIIGAVLVLSGIMIVFYIKPDSTHVVQISTMTKLLLVFGMVGAFSSGMMFEKLAIDAMGVWQYARYGWLMQFVCATIIVGMLGRREIVHTSQETIKKALVLGLLTSVAGGLYILALSLGTLSDTVLAVSAKVTLTSVLAYLILRERNALGLRLIALIISLFGMVLIVG